MNICKNVEAQRVRNTVFIKMLSLNIYQNHDTGRRKRGFHGVNNSKTHQYDMAGQNVSVKSQMNY